ncbi:acyl carrier protein [Streptomyces sp. NPDC048603]|uniref:acyl carrier protein n=1 Tax=Streptomyces sp. NPDC048603 TaxID=3365577 RepID=UPI00371570A4
MTDRELLDLLHQGLHRVTSRTFAPLSKDDRVQELGLDSLELLELVSWAEEQAGRRVPDAQLLSVATVGDLCTALGAVPGTVPGAVPGTAVAP